MFEIWKYTIDRVINKSSSRWNLWIYLLQMEAKAVKDASSLLFFSTHSELKAGLLYSRLVGFLRGSVLEWINKIEIQFLRFCLLVKIQSLSQIESNKRICYLFSSIFLLVRNETWPSKNFFGWSSCPAIVRKLFWSLSIDKKWSKAIVAYTLTSVLFFSLSSGYKRWWF